MDEQQGRACTTYSFMPTFLHMCNLAGKILSSLVRGEASKRLEVKLRSLGFARVQMASRCFPLVWKKTW